MIRFLFAVCLSVMCAAGFAAEGDPAGARDLRAKVKSVKRAGRAERQSLVRKFQAQKLEGKAAAIRAVK
jgi:hypothetical protein